MLSVPKEKLQRCRISILDAIDPLLVSRVARSIGMLPEPLVIDCGIKNMGFEDLGPSREYYPNHGYYVDNRLVLNSQLIDDSTLYRDSQGKELEAFDHILFHELGHGWDDKQGELSLSPEWLSLSGWSETPEKGKAQIIIKDKEEGKTKAGEWYYDPDAKFVRYYARTNPWDDFADTFAFKVAGLEEFIPEEKNKYFEEKLKGYPW